MKYDNAKGGIEVLGLEFRVSNIVPPYIFG